MDAKMPACIWIGLLDANTNMHTGALTVNYVYWHLRHGANTK